MNGRNSETLVKNSAKGDIFWTISLDQNDYSTQVQSGADGRFGRKFGPKTHRNITEARKYMNAQVKVKLKQGYKRSRNWRKKKNLDEDDFTESAPNDIEAEEEYVEDYPAFDRRFQGDLHYGADNSYDAGPRKMNLKRKSSYGGGGRKKKLKTMEEEIFLANKRADALKRGEPIPSDNDTDSLVSSEASFSQSKKSRVGISPLNRRRSIRLALKRGGSLMDTSSQLVRQNTVDMTIPRKIERMDTTTRWDTWRPSNSRQGSDTLMFGKLKSYETMDTLPRQESIIPKLFKRQSTTTCLRQMFATTGIESKVEIPNVFADSPTISDDKQEINNEEIAPKATVMKRLGFKKSVIVMPSLDEAEYSSDSTDGLVPDDVQLPFKRISKSPLTPPAELVSAKKSRMTRSKSQVTSAKVFQPAKRLWPVHFDAQVVWRVPFSSEGLDEGCCGICFLEEGCYIGRRRGQVIKLDSAVNHALTVELPQGIQFMACDQNRVLCACRRGMLYEVSGGEWQLLHDFKNKSQVLALCGQDDHVYISRPKGVLLSFDQHFQETWRISTKKNLAEWLRADDTGVYVGHSAGVSKYTLVDGGLIWDTVLPKKPTAGEMHNGRLYVGCRNTVVKLDPSSGKVLKTYGEAAKNQEMNGCTAACVAVGGGMLFHMHQSIRCYDEESGHVVYILNPPEQMCIQIKYYKGRLFFVGENCVSTIDFSPDTINNVQRGIEHAPVDVNISPDPASKVSLRRTSTLPIRSLKRRASREIVGGPPAQRRCKLKSEVLKMNYHD